jgi:hypothetical protein
VYRFGIRSRRDKINLQWTPRRPPLASLSASSQAWRRKAKKTSERWRKNEGGERGKVKVETE